MTDSPPLTMQDSEAVMGCLHYVATTTSYNWQAITERQCPDVNKKPSCC